MVTTDELDELHVEEWPVAWKVALRKCPPTGRGVLCSTRSPPHGHFMGQSSPCWSMAAENDDESYFVVGEQRK